VGSTRNTGLCRAIPCKRTLEAIHELDFSLSERLGWEEFMRFAFEDAVRDIGVTGAYFVMSELDNAAYPDGF